MTVDINQLKIGDVVPVPPKPKSEQQIMANWQGDLSKPLVSVLCITYNHEIYIEDSIKGFLSQKTKFPFEIWIHDDASTDNTKVIIQNYIDQYPNIIKAIFQEENQYSQGVRPTNTLIQSVKGKYVALCEGDDYWISTNKISLQVSAMERHPKIGLSIHPAYRLDVKNNRIMKDFDKGNIERVLNVEEAVSSRNQYAPTASYLFKASHYKTMPDWFFNAKDLPFGDYFIESIIGRHGLLYIPSLYSVYRRNVSGSYTERTSKLSVEDLVSRMNVILKYTDKLRCYSEISDKAIQERQLNIILDYQEIAVNRSSYKMFKIIKKVIYTMDLENLKEPINFSFLRFFFAINHKNA